MVLDRARGLWVIVLSFLAAFVLSVVTLPDFVPEVFSYGRPEWVALVLFYWVLALPHRVGVAVGWFSGLILDVIEGTLLGQHALSFVLVAYIAVSLYQRLRMFPVWQQALIVFATVGLAQLLRLGIESIAGDSPWSYLYLLSSVVSALLWPWVFLGLRFLRHRFNVY